MDFRLTEEHSQLQDSARRFVQAELLEVARELEDKDEPPPDEWRG